MKMQSPSAIAVRGLRKSFDGKLVLNDIDLDIADGTVFALLLPNGAGKTDRRTRPGPARRGGAGIGGSYIDYLAPGLLIMTGAASMVSTAVSVCTDMTEGIVDRLRTMSISRFALLAGHVLGHVLQTVAAMAILLAVALGIGFRPHADALHWLGAAGLAALTAWALTWVALAMALSPKAPETAAEHGRLPGLAPAVRPRGGTLSHALARCRGVAGL